MTASRFVALALALALAGCSAEQLGKDMSSFTFFQSKGEQSLSSGIKNYEDANYKDALQDLQNSLDAGLSKASEVKARKYLAFIHCVSGREKQCYDEFNKALDLNPDLELTPAEAGHPVWGPVFRAVKTKRR